MSSPILNALKILAIQLFFATNFFLAAWLKWSQSVPGWFTNQFEPTWLARAPGGLSGVYYLLAVFETIALLGFTAGILRLEFFAKRKPFLKFALVWSLFVFTVLAYGSRLTGKYYVAAYNLIYFAGALLCWREVMHDEQEQM